MNILFIHETDYINKVTYEWHNLAEGLASKGHRILVLDYPHKWDMNTQYGVFSSISRTGKGKITLIRPLIVDTPIISRISAFFSHYAVIERLLKTKQIDAIILYSIPTNGLQTVYLARKYDVPVVFRSLDILNQIVKFKGLRTITKYLEKIVYQNVDLILTITPKLTEYVKKLGARNVKLLPLYVDLEKFQPKEFEDKHIVLFVGSLHEFSGLDVIIKQFPLVLKEILDAKLVIVGDGEYRYKLELIIQNRDNIQILGYKDYSEIPDYINSASICICPFKDTKLTRDIFPSKIIQYMACGKCVITTPLDGVKALLKQGNGVVYSLPEAFSNKIIYFLKNTSYREFLGKTGFEYVNENHRDILERFEKEIVDVKKR